LDNLLIGNVLELARSIDKFLPNLVCQLEYCDKVADTITKAHRDVECNAFIAAYERKLDSRKRSPNTARNILST
jgi:hypothetical protein